MSAILIYKKQKKDEMRNAATIIVMELRSMEESIKSLIEIKDFYSSSTPIIAKSEWEKSKHLFVKELDDDDFKVIEEFYSLTRRIEEERIILREVIKISIVEKSKALQWEIMKLANEMKEKSKSDFDVAVKKMYDIAGKSTPEYGAQFAKNTIENLIGERIYPLNQNAGAKLKKIAFK